MFTTLEREYNLLTQIEFSLHLEDKEKVDAYEKQKSIDSLETVVDILEAYAGQPERFQS